MHQTGQFRQARRRERKMPDFAGISAQANLFGPGATPRRFSTIWSNNSTILVAPTLVGYHREAGTCITGSGAPAIRKRRAPSS